MSDVDKLRAQGLDVETVGDILGNGTKGTSPTTPFVPARLGSAPPLPESGIYFGMSDEEYHALPALSASGVKLMAASPMLFWAKASWLNPEREEEVAEAEQKKDHLPIGKAYHCRILEGRDAFHERFVADPGEPDFGEDVIKGTDAIKAAILRLNEAPYTRIATGEYVPNPKKPDEQKALTRAAVKADWIAQLQSLDPDARIYELLFEEYEREFEQQHAGKTKLPEKVIRRIEIAAAMIERDGEIVKHIRGGQPEVVLIWHCPTTGIPMKAKIDYAKVKRMIDLKSLANQRERSIEQAIRWEISGWKYTIQPSFYCEGAKIVRQLVRQHGASVVHSCDYDTSAEGFAGEIAQSFHADRVAWAMKWAKHLEPDEWAWLFQQKGIAPVARLVWYSSSTIRMITDDIISFQKKRFREFSETYGTAPWLDVAPPYWINDEDIPQSAVEI